MRPRLTSLGAPFLLALLACGEREQAPGPAATQPSLPAGHPAIPEGPTRDAGTSLALSGEVLETMDSGGYTYVRLGTAEGELWVAGPVTPIEVGQRLTLGGATDMGSFTSSSLGRTFDQIHFVGTFVADAAPASGRRGVAKRVLQGNGYTYVEVDVSETISWIAGPQADVREGDTVVWQGGNEMGEFHSPTLDLRFDNILFVERIWVQR